jgi:hypothetical protein
MLCVYRVALTCGEGQMVEETLLPIWIALQAADAAHAGCAATGEMRHPRIDQWRRLDEILRTSEANLQALISAYARQRAGQAGEWHAAAAQLLLRREHAMAACADAQSQLSTNLAQQGLFDRRATRAAERRTLERALDRSAAARRTLTLDTGPLRIVLPREPALVLIVSRAGGIV